MARRLSECAVQAALGPEEPAVAQEDRKDGCKQRQTGCRIGWTADWLFDIGGRGTSRPPSARSESTI